MREGWELDLEVSAGAFGTSSSSNPDYDLSGDGVVGPRDHMHAKIAYRTLRRSFIDTGEGDA